MLGNVIDLTKGVGYKINSFPDGEKQIVLENLDRKHEVSIITRLKSSDDLFLLMQISDIINREGLFVSEIFIPYLMSARCDRRFSSNHPFSLKIVADVINSLNAYKVILADVHSGAALKLIKNSVSTQYQQDIVGRLCFPDNGSYLRYNGYNNNDDVYCDKVRDVESGQLISFKLNNPSGKLGGKITVFDDLCDGGGTFLGIAPLIRELNPEELNIRVTHAIQEQGIIKLSEVYDNVYITNSYADWDKMNLPKNVFVKDIINN